MQISEQKLIDIIRLYMTNGKHDFDDYIYRSESAAKHIIREIEARDTGGSND